MHNLQQHVIMIAGLSRRANNRELGVLFRTDDYNDVSHSRARTTTYSDTYMSLRINRILNLRMASTSARAKRIPGPVESSIHEKVGLKALA